MAGMRTGTNAIRQATAGEPVIALSELMSQLRATVGEDKANAILASLVPTQSAGPSPGGLISAWWANDIAKRLLDLESKGAGSRPDYKPVRDCLVTAANAFAGLSSGAMFVPSDPSVPPKAVQQLSGVLQRVVQAALAGVARAQTVDEAEVLSIFSTMYQSQRDLLSFLTSPVLGTTDAGQKSLFTQLLTPHLEEDRGPQQICLRSAIAVGDVAAATSAQSRINAVAASHSGDVTLGNLEVIYQTSSDGETILVTGQDEYRYTFRVFNKTNRTLDANISAAFRSPRNNWNDGLRLVNTSTLRGLRPFDPSMPTDPRAFGDIEVAVKDPKPRALDDKGTLELFAIAPAPIVDVGNSGTVVLTVGAKKEDPVTSRLGLVTDLTPDEGDASAAPVDERVAHRSTANFHTGTAGAKASVIVSVVVLAPAAEADAAKFEINMGGAIGSPINPVKDAAHSTPKLVKSSPFELANDQDAAFQVRVVPRTGAANKTLRYKVRLETAAGDLTPAEGQEITIDAVA